MKMEFRKGQERNLLVLVEGCRIRARYRLGEMNNTSFAFDGTNVNMVITRLEKIKELGDSHDCKTGNRLQ